MIKNGARILWRTMPAALLPSLAACTVPIGGVTGVAADADGAPVGVLAVCEGAIDGLTLYTGAGECEKELGSWRAPNHIRRSAKLPMASPPEGWATETPLARLSHGRTYTVYGWTADNDWSTVAVSFTVEDLHGLRPGQGLYMAYDEASDKTMHLRVGQREFRDQACVSLRD